MVSPRNPLTLGNTGGPAAYGPYPGNSLQTFLGNLSNQRLTNRKQRFLENTTQQEQQMDQQKQDLARLKYEDAQKRLNTKEGLEARKGAREIAKQHLQNVDFDNMDDEEIVDRFTRLSKDIAQTYPEFAEEALRPLGLLVAGLKEGDKPISIEQTRKAIKEYQRMVLEPEKDAAPTNLKKLMDEHNALAKDDPNREIYKKRIEKEISTTQKRIDIGADGSISITEGPAGDDKGKIMPASEVGKLGEFKAYSDTIDQIGQAIKRAGGDISTGPAEIIRKKIDDWGVWPNEDRIELRTRVARLPGLMYALRGKQLSDKELEVALEMMPKMSQAPVAFMISLKNFKEYMDLLIKGKKKAFRGAGYQTGAFAEGEVKEMSRDDTITAVATQLESMGFDDDEIKNALIEGGYVNAPKK